MMHPIIFLRDDDTTQYLVVSSHRIELSDLGNKGRQGSSFAIPTSAECIVVSAGWLAINLAEEVVLGGENSVSATRFP